ncbi:MAG: ribokinase [Actinomycetota bacterium]|nr:ribokinase [Actinomycetota bacterium]
MDISVRQHALELIERSDLVQAPLAFVRELDGVDDVQVGAKLLYSLGARSAVVTDRAEGSGWVDRDGKAGRVPAFPVQAVDTLGAGDVFCGGLAHAHLCGLPLEQAVVLASAAAAWKVRRWGKTRLPSETDLRDFIDPSSCR